MVGKINETNVTGGSWLHVLGVNTEKRQHQVKWIDAGYLRTPIPFYRLLQPRSFVRINHNTRCYYLASKIFFIERTKKFLQASDISLIILYALEIINTVTFKFVLLLFHTIRFTIRYFFLKTWQSDNFEIINNMTFVHEIYLTNLFVDIPYFVSFLIISYACLAFIIIVT